MNLLLLLKKHLCVFWDELSLRLAVFCCRCRRLLSEVLDGTWLPLKWSSCAFSSFQRWVGCCCFWQLFHWGERWFESGQRGLAAHTWESRHGRVWLLIELLVQIRDQVLIGFQALLCLLQLRLQSCVQTFQLADLYLKKLTFLHLPHRLPHQIVNFLLSVCWLLLGLSHSLLLGLVFLFNLLGLLLKLLDNLVTFSDFIFCSLYLRFKLSVWLF